MNSSRILFSAILIILILFNTLRVSLTYAYYEIDPIGFIEALCENTDKPELACNGKCHLKKIVKSQDKDQKNPESILDFKELILFSSALESVVFNKKKHLKKQQPTTYLNLYSFTNTNGCFHPPQV